MRMRYGHLQNSALDTEDENHQLIPGAWRDGGMMQAIGKMKGANRASTEGIQQREYMKQYFNSPAGSVSWQDQMI